MLFLNAYLTKFQATPLRTTTGATCAALVALLIVSPGNALAQGRDADRNLTPRTVRATLPVAAGWFSGQSVFYTSTEASTADVAAAFGANFSPRLASSSSASKKPIYVVTNFTQANIVPSAPSPAGSGNLDKNYSPLWQVVTVTWNAAATPQVLRSEAEVLAAQAAGTLTTMKTLIVVNCSIVYTQSGGVLPGTTLNFTAGAKPGSTVVTATLPVVTGWFNGQSVQYISPEASDAGAGGPTANLSLSLAASAGGGGVEDLYAVTNFKQGNIIPSAPLPAGPGSTAAGYTPLWQVNLVTWKPNVTPRVLTSQADVLAAVSAGSVSVQKTTIVVNCPVVSSPLGGAMPGVVLTSSR